MSKQILIVDDDKTLSTVLKEYLESKAFDCTVCHNGREAKTALNDHQFDLCILDVKMPIEDGFQLAATISNHYGDLPFIFLTGEQRIDDRIKGLEAGAEDYIIKPFSMRELHLRIENVLKRQSTPSKLVDVPTTCYDIGRYVFVTDERQLKLDNETIDLTWIEAQLLTLFCTSASGIIERNHALTSIWADEHQFKQRSLNVYVSRLRQYLKQDTNISIRNIHGKGYQLIVRAD